jgi:hypothetical protein
MKLLKVPEPVPKPGWFRSRLPKKRHESRFSSTSKFAVPKTELLEQPLLLYDFEREAQQTANRI